MKLDIKSIPKKATSILKKLSKYSVFIFVIFVLLAYGFIVVRIRTLASTEPSDDAVSEQLNTLSKPKIDKQTIDKIQKLQDSNVQVKALFDQARDNPFQD